MKTLLVIIISLLLSITSIFANETSPLKTGFTAGNPEVTSINAMTFGPEGILFIGDSKSAQVVAIDLSAHAKTDNSKVRIDKLDQQIADMLGAAIDQVQITDMVVNPENNNIYISVMHGSGNPLLLRVENNALKAVALDNVSFTKSEITDPVSNEAKDRRGRQLRRWAVADIKYTNGKVLLSGLSNKEFASTFRSIDFPFNKKQNYGSLEIYHAAHGKYETHAPIKTFLTADIAGVPHIVAAYTCTPLVVFPMSDVKPGQHTKGRTIAELGSGNSPLDIVEVKSDNAHYLLISNSNRPLMRLDFDDLESFKASLTEPVTIKGAAVGVDYVNMPFVNVQQLDAYDKGFVMIQRESSGNLALKHGSPWWLSK